MMEHAGLIHLYVGDGKGKTTAAAGLALRALGSGRRVLFSQFLKGKPSHEIRPLQQLGAAVLRADNATKFVFRMSEEEKAEATRNHTRALEEIRGRMLAGEFDLIVLDEVVDAANCQVIPLAALLALLDEKPPAAELVLTGRNPAPELVERCHYHTEFVCRKHPYHQGVPAREGIEF